MNDPTAQRRRTWSARVGQALQDDPLRCFLALVLFIVLLCVGWYFLVRHGFPDHPKGIKEHHRLEILANVGTAFQIVSASFAALAFAGVLFTVYLQSTQIFLQSEQIQAGLNQQHLLSLQKRVGELIGDADKTLKNVNPGVFQGLEISAREIAKTRDQEVKEGQFLEDLALGLAKHFPAPDKLRRRNVFKALDSLISNSPPHQQALFRESLLAQIHETAARMLILQAIAANDLELLTIFSKVGLGFSSIQESNPKLYEELEYRFSNSHASTGTSKASLK